MLTFVAVELATRRIHIGINCSKLIQLVHTFYLIECTITSLWLYRLGLGPRVMGLGLSTRPLSSLALAPAPNPSPGPSLNLYANERQRILLYRKAMFIHKPVLAHVLSNKKCAYRLGPFPTVDPIIVALEQMYRQSTQTWW